MRWTDKDESRLGFLAEAGLSGAQIARALERTRPAIYSKAAAMGYPISGEGAALGKALDDGIALVRDDLGALGARWTTASRSGDIYIHSPAAECLLQLGRLKRLHGDTYVAA